MCARCARRLAPRRVRRPRRVVAWPGPRGDVFSRAVVVRRRGGGVVWLAERAEDPTFVFVLIPMAHAQVERPGVHHFGFTVDSRAAVDAVAATARDDGILRGEPRDAGPVVGYFCVVEDPDGNWVE